MSIILTIISASLLYISFPNVFFSFGINIFAWIFAVPLFIALEEKSFAKRILIGLIFGIVFYSALVIWFIPYSFPGYILFVFFLTLQPVIFCCFKLDTKWNSLFIPCCWVASEYVRMLVMGGFSWGLGHSQTFNIYVIQLADLFGGYGISFVVVLVNYCIYGLLRDKQQRKQYVALLIIVGLSLNAYVYLFTEPGSKRFSPIVRTFQPNIDYKKKLDEEYVDKLVDEQILLTKEVRKARFPSALVVWPETAIPFDFLNEKKTRVKIDKLVKESDAYFLIGASLSQEGKNYNSAVLLDSSSRVKNVYNKTKLIPFAEFIPDGIFRKKIAEVFNVKSFDLEHGDKLSLFEIPRNKDKRIYHDLKFGVVICSEDTIGGLFRQYALKGADFVVVLLNDGWFKNDAAYILHAQNSIMNAVANRIQVLRVSNTGWSSLVRKDGRVNRYEKANFDKRIFCEYAIGQASGLTCYSIIGDVFCLICICFVIISLIRIVMSQRPRKWIEK